MRQLQLMAHGEPSDVIELNAVQEPALGQEDVLISMEAGAAQSIRFSICPWYAVFRTTGLVRGVISAAPKLCLDAHGQRGLAPPELQPAEMGEGSM